MSEPFQPVNQPSILTISAWEKFGIVAGITTRQGGYSDSPYHSLNMGDHVGDDLGIVEKNRHRVAEIIGFPRRNWVMPNQVHGVQVNLITVNHSKTISCDGLVTNRPGQLLTAVFADCVPLYFFADKQKWIGLAHAGWRGTVGGIGREMVRIFKDQGIDPSELSVVIGPCIGRDQYEVDQHVIQHIPENLQTEELIQPVRPGHYLLDLKQLNKTMLVDAGVRQNRIEITDLCTYDKEEWFFSHRRDQGKTGRMMAFIGIKNE
ncbi:hypothetical protein EDD68_101212 [Melghiribacillus thermohalophilus]|uniref:Purine nucleoside phosphorylase n=1 Tax=Melghiribacillus thermohalophilus TaxID=1324956 RepID=A0A4R3ND58_9BACI|nr:peptidoglycan editing factor PgeF [Melghiribacillus thermohalophilus]TCT26856.1 hypothetical protein EDD68_101212 [Melghiribacillus thermohalophilus]